MSKPTMETIWNQTLNMKIQNYNNCHRDKVSLFTLYILTSQCSVV